MATQWKHQDAAANANMHAPFAFGPANQTEYRDYGEAESTPEAGTFEIGLVLAGAISAGAYSAGVMDFLIEALDAWEEAKVKAPGSVPTHSVKIRVIAGASAGAMNGAIASSALMYRFDHGAPRAGQRNPFYESWVRNIDASHLLGLKDLSGPKPEIASLLDSTQLTYVTRTALDYSAPRLARPYLKDGVRFIFTQSGLRGIPYYLALDPQQAHPGLHMSLHRTYRSFSVSYGDTAGRFRADDLPLSELPDGASKFEDKGWNELGIAALASGAFPLFLKARHERRKPADLDWRFVQGARGDYVKLKPAWKREIGGRVPPPPAYYAEYVVDGGAMNNEPLELARQELTGLKGNFVPRGDAAQRCVLVIDPFPDEPATEFPPDHPNARGDLISIASALLSAYKYQARFNPTDLARGLDPDDYSRFVIAPSRKPDVVPPDWKKPPADIASASLDGFGGFLDETYRHHDYLLGRRNCQQFLLKHFGVWKDNPAFVKSESNINARFSGRLQDSREFALIPLIGQLAETPPLPAWPTKKVDLDAVADSVVRRAAQLAKELAKRQGFKWKVLVRLALLFGRNDIKSGVINILMKSLDSNDLPYLEPKRPREEDGNGGA